MRKNGSDRLLYITGLDYGEIRVEPCFHCAAPTKGRNLDRSAERIVVSTPACINVKYHSHPPPKVVFLAVPRATFFKSHMCPIPLQLHLLVATGSV